MVLFLIGIDLIDIAYWAAMALDGPIAFVHSKGAVSRLPDPDLDATLKQEGVLKLLNADHFYQSVGDAIHAFRLSAG